MIRLILILVLGTGCHLLQPDGEKHWPQSKPTTNDVVIIQAPAPPDVGGVSSPAPLERTILKSSLAAAIPVPTPPTIRTQAIKLPANAKDLWWRMYEWPSSNFLGYASGPNVDVTNYSTGKLSGYYFVGESFLSQPDLFTTQKFHW